MKVFVAASYSSRVNYDTGEIFPEYKDWLENVLITIEGFGHTVFCSLRQDRYKINEANPGEAYNLDAKNVRSSDAVIALLDDKVSAGVQTEVGYALALMKLVVLAHEPNVEFSWFNKAIVRAGKATAVKLPLTRDPFITK